MDYKKIPPKKIVDFMIVAGKLKWTKRSGWLEKEMPEPETVAEHTFRVTILSLILAKKLNIDANKITSMAIFHDLAEGVLGDPITERGGKIVGKHNLKEECRFMKKVFSNLGMPRLYSYWYENILENTRKKTIYSDILYQIGKIATVWQALEYELMGVPKNKTEEFWVNALTRVNNQLLLRLLNVLQKIRKYNLNIKYPFIDYKSLPVKSFEERIVNFMLVVGSLKWIKRSGWVDIHVFEPETVAEHIFRVTILSRILAEILKFDKEKITAMAILHDFAEGLFGDEMIEGNNPESQFIFLNNSTTKKVDFNVKEKKEFIKKFFSYVKLIDLYYSWREQFNENYDKASMRSHFIFEVGKLANVWQALEYELRGVPQNLTERFWQSADFFIKHPYLKEILKILKKMRNSKTLII